MNIKNFLKNLNQAVQEELGVDFLSRDVDDATTPAIEGRLPLTNAGNTYVGFIVANKNMVYAYCGYPRTLPLDKIDKANEIAEKMNTKLSVNQMGKAFINDRYFLINSSAIPLLIVDPETHITKTVRETEENFPEKHGGFKACFKSAIDEYTEFFKLLINNLVADEFGQLDTIYHE